MSDRIHVGIELTIPELKVLQGMNCLIQHKCALTRCDVLHAVCEDHTCLVFGEHLITCNFAGNMTCQENNDL